MNSLVSLIKIGIEDTLSKTTSKKASSILSIVLSTLLLLVLISAFLNFIVISAFGYSSYFYPLFLSITLLSIIFFTSIYRVKAILFSVKDKVILNPLPLKKSTIISSKLILAYLEELIFGVVVYLPCIFLYSIDNPSFIFFGIMLSITTPMIALLFAFIVGFLLQMLTLRLPWLRYIGVALYILFVVSICLLSFITSEMETSGEIIDYTDMLSSYTNIFPLNLVYKGFILGELSYFFLYLGIAILTTIIVVFLYSVFYDKIYQAMDYIGNKPKYNKEQIKKSNINLSLIKNNLKEVVGNTMFFVAVLIPGIIVAIIYFGYHITLSGLVEGTEFNYTMVIMTTLIMFCVLGISCYSSFAINLEGKNFWIVKTLPISDKVYLRSKLIVNQFFTGIITLIVSIVLATLNYIDIITSITVIIAPQLYIYFIGIIGLIFNLRFPKLIWSNYNQIKNSISSILTTIIGIVLGIIIFVLAIILDSYTVISYSVTILVISIILAITAYILYNKIAFKLYKKIEV